MCATYYIYSLNYITINPHTHDSCDMRPYSTKTEELQLIGKLSNIHSKKNWQLPHLEMLILNTFGFWKSERVKIDLSRCLIVLVNALMDRSNCLGACNRWYSSRPQTIVVPPVGNGCPNGWDNHSQRVGRCVFHIFLPCLYVSQRNHHSGCIHYLHRCIHYFSCSLSACYVLVYAVYAIFKIKFYLFILSTAMAACSLGKYS